MSKLTPKMANIITWVIISTTGVLTGGGIGGIVAYNKIQEKLAEKCNLSPRYISDIENANGNIPIDTVQNIAKCLKVEPYQILKPHNHQPLPKRVNMK